jgi:hypothetical protein
MSGEFKDRIEALGLDEDAKQKVLTVIKEAGVGVSLFAVRF